MRLSIISFAATARTLVAVGTVNEPSIDCTTLAATPRSGSTEDAPGVTKVGIGLTIGSAGLNVVLATTTGSTFSTTTGAITTGGVTTAAAGAGLANSFLERLINAVIQASKRIKNETEISSGATSVAFASVQYIINNVEGISQKNILLFGTGKIGRNTCENLVKHTKNDHIVLINRTKDKAERIAGKFNLIVKDYTELQLEIQKADVLIVATGAQNPTIDKDILNLKKPLLILDLSIPKNVNENVKTLDNVSLVHMDYLSQLTDDTLEKRKLHIPAAEAIIDEVKSEFISWMKARKFAPTIHALKEKLNSIKEGELDFQRKKIANFDQEQAEIISNRIIQKITTHFANHLKDDNTMVDESIEWIEKIFQIETAVK